MDDRWSANVLTQELEVDADALVDALKAGIRDKSATVQVRSAQARSQLIYELDSSRSTRTSGRDPWPRLVNGRFRASSVRGARTRRRA